ncbi:tetratricopeptide repeat protein [Qipengyuania sp. DSG2-2]|uniref:tetratricopeptide repeat protein n=1 Tax=Qipengyuania sp. DGS2-2 TaxID=3349631 RepID=UPI0036D42ABB
MTETPAALAQSAQMAMQEGRYDDAHPILATLHAMLPEDPMVLLMQAYTYRAQGKGPEAHAHFQKAVALQPANLALRGPYAEWLNALGEFEAAIEQYDAMLAHHPDLPDAEVDRLLALARTAHRAEALEGLAGFVSSHPDHTRAANNLALLLREDDRLDEAGAVAKGVLARDSHNGRAAHIIAQCRQEAGKPAGAALQKAASLAPDALQIQSALAQSLVDEGRAEDGIALLERAVAANPLWLEGHHSLADIKRQYRGVDGFAAHFETTLAESADNPALWATYSSLVARVEGHEAALSIVERAEKALGSPELMALARANSLSELGRFDEAESAFAKLDVRQDTDQASSYLRFLTRAKRFEEARDLGMALADEGRADGETWPYTAIALRKTDDPRWEWLEGHDAFIRTFDLADFAPSLPELREALNALHVFKHQPITQSVRGGTQTASILFRNQTPVIQELVAGLRDCVRDYVDGLPPFDARHPLLRLPREGFRFSGSWSIRLTEGGFHASHIHTHGDISSAFYVTLPDDLSDGEGTANGTDPKAGWLTLGEPAAELDTGLPPIRMVKPEPARLALFPSTMWHGTRAFREGERMTCAFDVQLKPYL